MWDTRLAGGVCGGSGSNGGALSQPGAADLSPVRISDEAPGNGCYGRYCQSTAQTASHCCTVVDPGGVTLLNGNSLEPIHLYTCRWLLWAVLPVHCADLSLHSVGFVLMRAAEFSA